jgi:uncharacterized protein (DUF2236 family)
MSEIPSGADSGSRAQGEDTSLPGRSRTGEGGVAFRINGERLMILGWTRAILLQLAHPLIAAGVYEHSGFRASPLAAIQRLHHTTHAMLAITFGDEAQHRAAIDGIRRIHTRVNGTLRETVGRLPAGTPYSAEDPALLLWVHATLIESVLLTYELLVGPLTRVELDDYCAVSAPSSIELGMREEEAPRTWSQLQDYLRRTYASGTISVGPQASELADALLRTSMPGPMAPARWVTGLLTSGMLPPAIREEYGLTWNATRQRRFERLTATIRMVRRVTPAPVAIWADARRAR